MPFDMQVRNKTSRIIWSFRPLKRSRHGTPDGLPLPKRSH